MASTRSLITGRWYRGLRQGVVARSYRGLSPLSASSVPAGWSARPGPLEARLAGRPLRGAQRSPFGSSGDEAVPPDQQFLKPHPADFEARRLELEQERLLCVGSPGVGNHL